MIDDKCIRLIIDKYFNQKNILENHQIESYDDFIDNILPSILSQFFPLIIEFNGNAQVGDVELMVNLISNEDGYVQYEASLPLELTVSDFEVLLGDVTNDSAIDVLDIVSIVNIILENVDPSNYELIAADLNQDSLVNIQDIILLVNIIMSN